MAERPEFLPASGHFSDGLTSATIHNMFPNLGCSVTRIWDLKYAVRDEDGAEATLNILGPDRPGLLAKFSDLLLQCDANIESSIGWRIRKDLHQSSITFSTTKGQVDRIMQKIDEIRCDQVVIDSGQQEEAMKTYELKVTAPDERGIFREVTNILSRDHNGCAINIVSQLIRTYRHPDHPNLPVAYIELRLEVPLDLVPHISEIIDEIREYGREDCWHVDEREWIDNADSKGFDVPPTNRLPSDWVTRRH
jgi:glycine cleavage system regulatory protein